MIIMIIIIIIIIILIISLSLSLCCGGWTRMSDCGSHTAKAG